MAVVAVWKCDRDNKMFENKKDAEDYDRMLELAANITALIEENVEGVDENHSESIGLLLAKNSERLAKACKGKPGILLEVDEEKELNSQVADSDKVSTIESVKRSA